MEFPLKMGRWEINSGGKGAKKRFKLVRSEGPKDLVFQSLRKGAPISDGNVLRPHLLCLSKTRNCMSG
jgi:hypothetical protein